MKFFPVLCCAIFSIPSALAFVSQNQVDRSLHQKVLFGTTERRHPETISPVPVHYKHTVEALEAALKEQRESLKKIEMLAARLRDMEAHHPHLSSAASQANPRLLQAIHDVKVAMDHRGVTSADTKRAWTKVETILAEGQQQQQRGSASMASEFSSSTLSEAAFRKTSSSSPGGDEKDRYAESSLRHHHDYQSILDPDLLQASMESIENLLAFEHFVAVEKRLLDAKIGNVE